MPESQSRRLYIYRDYQYLWYLQDSEPKPLVFAHTENI